MRTYLFVFLTMFSWFGQAQIVTDWDGNQYDEIEIGTQVWIQQNLKSLHYADGTPIPDVVAYNDNDSLAGIYGRLYTWDAAMRNAKNPMSQGVCPDGWHVPSHPEWSTLENFLGGASIAGGALKSTGYDHWNPPNTGATNSSGFTALAAGEYDAYYSPNTFQLFMEYAVFWTSTEVSSLKARERFLAYNSAKSDIYDWFKVMKYSIRCVRDAATTSGSLRDKLNYQLLPDPVSSILYVQFPEPVSGKILIRNMAGQSMKTVTVDEETAVEMDVQQFANGLYLLQVISPQSYGVKRFIKNDR